ncbi:MAG TPA: hypothetical protein VHF01_16200 [Candidatus Acidoferrum sp.]|nr:hypothetical protein [Candidatus Acidoferrum sp.]
MTTLASALCFFLAVLPLLRPRERKEKPPDSSHLSILGVAIGQDNLATLQSKLGPVKKCHTKRHDDVEIAGYTDAKENLVFEFGEIGGGEVTAFYLSLPRSAPSCPLSHLSSEISGLTTKGGIHLGMTEEEFIRIFGPPESRTQRGRWKYSWTWEVKLTEAEKKAAASATPGYTVSDTADVVITIEARFTKGVLQYFYISKLEAT